MTTEKHTPLPFGAALTAAIMNAPLSQLDAAIIAIEDALAQSALAITTTDAVAASGQAVVPVTATDNFIVGQSVHLRAGASFEARTILSIQAGVSLTMTANLTNTYASGSIVSASPEELVEARGAYSTLAARLRGLGTVGTAHPPAPVANDISIRSDRGGAAYIWTGAAWRQINVPEVTAFWGTPSTNDRCFRTDLGGGLEYKYDGTRWLSTVLYNDPIAPAMILPATATAVTNRMGLPNNLGAIVGETFWFSFLVTSASALSASHKWVCSLMPHTGSALATINIDSGASGVWRSATAVAISPALIATTVFEVHVDAIKTGTPGDLTIEPRMSYRLVGP